MSIDSTVQWERYIIAVKFSSPRIIVTSCGDTVMWPGVSNLTRSIFLMSKQSSLESLRAKTGTAATTSDGHDSMIGVAIVPTGDFCMCNHR